MGLAERRAAKEFETNRYPSLKAQVIQAAGFEVPIEVHWETLSTDEQSHLYDDCWPKVYFAPLIEALKSITRDDIGKEALKGGLKKIVIQNRAGTYYGDRMAQWEKGSGTLTLDHEPCTNVDNVKERTDGITKALETNL
jgi:hypothetical protein